MLLIAPTAWALAGACFGVALGTMKRDVAAMEESWAQRGDPAAG